MTEKARTSPRISMCRLSLWGNFHSGRPVFPLLFPRMLLRPRFVFPLVRVLFLIAKNFCQKDTVYNDDELIQQAPDPEDYYTDLCRMLDGIVERHEGLHADITNYVAHDGALQMLMKFIARYDSPFRDEPQDVQDRRSMAVWKIICWWVINPPVPSDFGAHGYTNYLHTKPNSNLLSIFFNLILF